MARIVKTTVNLPSEELDALKQLAERRSVSVTHALRQAIQTELFVQRLVDQGGTLLVQSADGDLQQLVFSQTQSGLPAAAHA
jgi:hypothetical protein